MSSTKGPGRPKKTERLEAVRVSLPPGVVSGLEAAAAELGLSLSAYCRALLLASVREQARALPFIAPPP
jgi:hypothetical protein